jgi:hypothetical protein
MSRVGEGERRGRENALQTGKASLGSHRRQRLLGDLRVERF